MNHITYRDPFLEKRLETYDKWLQSGKISYSSRIIPVTESLKSKQWILPMDHVMDIFKKAESLAVQSCICRSHYNKCNNPLEVCFLLNQTADKFVHKGKARHVDLTEAEHILKKANENGLVHLSLYMPDHEMYALCSCCPCCCHDLQIIKHYKRNDLLIRSEYTAVTDYGMCTGCGICMERCVFDARLFKDKILHFSHEACLGCGLCATMCPTGAISMEVIKKKDL